MALDPLMRAIRDLGGQVPDQPARPLGLIATGLCLVLVLVALARFVWVLVR